MNADIHGFCDLRFAPLRDAFAANFEAGLELGASLGVTHRGKAVVDLWAGHADLERTRPWARDTLVAVASTTKILMSIAILIAIDRGLLDLTKPIAHYWPEFAQGGKGADTVADAVTHHTGAPGLNPPAAWDVVRDWQAITARIAAEPHWSGGERRGIYHAATYGFILGELIRRVDGRLPWQFCREEILQGVGADFYLGITAEEDFARVATLLRPPPGPQPGAPEPPIEYQRALNSMAPAPDLRTTQAFGHPSGGAYTNGRGLARLCAILANGGELDGVRYMSARTAALAGEELSRDELPMFATIRYGVGFALDTKEFPMPAPSFYHWGGMGGSIGLIDPVSRISLGYTPNNWNVTGGGGFGVETRQGRLFGALAEVLPRL